MTDRADNTVRVTISKAGEDLAGLRATLTVLSGRHAGMHVELTGNVLVIGRGEEASLRLDEASLSRGHARLARVHGAWFIEDLDSTNGTFLNGARIGEPERLQDGAKVQVGEEVLLRFSLQDEREYAASQKLYEATVRDGLTGCYNRHYLDERIPAEFSYARRHATPLSVLFVDADHFKEINDRWGHSAGDEVLRRVASFLLQAVRTEDIVTRYGGEEFVLLVRGVPPAAVAAMAERLRAGIEALDIEVAGGKVPVTVTIGVASLTSPSQHEDGSALVAQADARLYQGKRAGRNRVVTS